MLISCPLHEDDKPSCSIDVEKGVYKCFGCGAQGDLFSLAVLAGATMPEAVHMAYGDGEGSFGALAASRPKKEWLPPHLHAPSDRAVTWLSQRGIEINERGEVTNILASRLPRFQEGEDVLGIDVWCAVARGDVDLVLAWEQWRYYRVMRKRKQYGKYYATPGFPRGRVLGLGGERDGPALYLTEGCLDALGVLLGQDQKDAPPGMAYYTFGAKVTIGQMTLIKSLLDGRRLITAFDNDTGGMDATLAVLRVFPDAEFLVYEGKDPGEAALHPDHPWMVRPGMEWLAEMVR